MYKKYGKLDTEAIIVSELVGLWVPNHHKTVPKDHNLGKNIEKKVEKES